MMHFEGMERRGNERERKVYKTCKEDEVVRVKGDSKSELRMVGISKNWKIYCN